MSTKPDPEADVSSTAWDEWESYRQLGQLINHWERPGWKDHARSYHWLLTFEHADELQELAVRCQDELRNIPTLDLVPPDLLHLTVQRIGFTDEMDPSVPAAIAEAAQARCKELEPFDIRVGPLTGSSGAVRFSVTPHESVKRVRDAVIGAIADVRGPDAVPDQSAQFIPHVSIAYSNAAQPAVPIIARVAHTRVHGSVIAQVSSADLGELRRESQHLYVWMPLKRITLESGND